MKIALVSFMCLLTTMEALTITDYSEVTMMLVITADRGLSSLFVDNISYPLGVYSSYNWSVPDHIEIPKLSSLIALRASNSFYGNCSGILASIGIDFVTDAVWKCSTDNSPGWYRTDFNDSLWPQAVMYGSNTSPFACEYRHQIPDIGVSANWIWTSDMGVSINCRVHLGGTESTADASQPTTTAIDPGSTGSRYVETTNPLAITIDPICGDISYYDSYGAILSPNYPGAYFNYLDCNYYVYASTGSSLVFIFKSFHVDNSDIVTISCPSNLNIPPQEYSGHTLPVPVLIPVCDQGRVNFRTDSSNVSSGFVIDYYVSDEDCENTLFIGSNGFVSSPNWPEFYRSNQNCSNIIWAPQQSTVNLYFHSFNVQDNCSCDWLEISCLDNSEYGPTRYCGSYGVLDLYIYQCSQVLLWFSSDDTGNYQGFFIEYTIYTSTAAACGELSYIGPSGVISSPSYPGNYSNLLFCDYTIYASAGSTLLLIFDSLSTQNSYDIVTISCPTNSNVSKREYSGNDVPSPVSIPDCSQGLVNFRTDPSAVSSGFSLTYYVNVAGCGNTVHPPCEQSCDHLTSPNWPSYYGYNEDCYHIIYGLLQKDIFLNFYTFILQDCCSCDWLEISCVGNSNSDPKRYCGSYDPGDSHVYNCSQVLLWFHSDSSINDQGFDIAYNIYSIADDSKVSSNGKQNASATVPTNG